VPAVIFSVSANFPLANCLASRSFGNFSVALACFRLSAPSSNETYHVLLGLPAMMRHSRENNQRQPGFVPRGFQSLPRAGPQDSFYLVTAVSNSLPGKDTPAAFLEPIAEGTGIVLGGHRSTMMQP
jgi:hypothetical protein